MKSMYEETVVVEEWISEHPAWLNLLDLIEGLEQMDWAAFTAVWHRSSHFLVAHQQGIPLGFVRYVIQDIGADADWSPIYLHGEVLTEAKVIAFGVAATNRRQGIGRRLQEALIRRAAAAGCYQVRSRSDASHSANHQLKLSMGFAIHPLDKMGERDGAYFILPLRSHSKS